MVLVPFLVMILDAQGFDRSVTIKLAIATSLATIVFTSLSSVRAHHKRGAVRWDIVRIFAPGLVLGTLLGAQIVGALPARLIAAFFAAFIGWTAVGMLRPKKPPVPGVAQRELPGTIGYIVAGWHLNLHGFTFGYVYLPALLLIAPASMLVAPLGARAAHALSVEKMRLVFALVLAALALYMLARALGLA